MDSKTAVFRTEYALSGRACCKGCDRSIAQDSVRICYKVQSRFHDGMDELWHHPSCFFKKKPGTSVDEIWHFHDLRWSDQEKIREMAENSMKSKSSGKKRKKRHEEDDIDDGDREPKKKATGEVLTEAEKRLKDQCDRLWVLKDQLKALKKDDLEELLENNNQHVAQKAKIIDRVADVVMFGPTALCSVCNHPEKKGYIVISADGYHCIGHLSDWAKCGFVTQSPKRTTLKIGDGLAKKYPFLKDYQKSPRPQRVFPACYTLGSQKQGESTDDITVIDGPSTSKANETSQINEQKPNIPKFASKRPLSDLKIAAVGNLSMKRADMTKVIAKLGGTYVTKVTKDVFVVISDERAIDSRPAMLEMAECCRIHVVPVEFLEDLQNQQLKTFDDVVRLVEASKINSWPTDPPQTRIVKKAIEALPSGLSSSELHRRSQQLASTVLENRDAEKLRVIVKNGAYLDPAADLDEEDYSVLRHDSVLYSCVLAKVNIEDGSNSYYRMQIAKHDRKEEYYFIRSWGRIGTTQGGTSVNDADDLHDAISRFEFHFHKQTDNMWDDRDNFQKKPNKYFIVEMDYGEAEEEKESKVVAGSKTSLPKPVQDLLRMIFDVEEFQRTMKEFQIDLKKMPLGKLSRNQITKAMGVLSELQEVLGSEDSSKNARIIDCSNRFFTLIPHDFGLKAPPKLNNLDMIKKEQDMLDNLLEIEVAFSILKTTDADSEMDPLDHHFAKLKCGITVVDKKSDEFDMISRYIQNTHGATHTSYKLELAELFKVQRQGEAERFEKYRDLHNHMLLWHGSRLTNYAGILSQGLRIAPPEAPVTGYMFGKGVYFADMVSKSANYCFTDRSKPTGLMLLSDVALGDMMELTAAQNVTKSTLKKKYHSVKGCGQNAPDPDELIVSPDGIQVPLGKPVKQMDPRKTSLLYNEYIVYDEAQVNIRYLLKVQFKYM